MGSYTVYICDRCSKRYDDSASDVFFPPNWVEINTMTGPPAEEVDDDWEGPEHEAYLLCDGCAPPVLRDLSSWVPKKAKD